MLYINFWICAIRGNDGHYKFRSYLICTIRPNDYGNVMCVTGHGARGVKPTSRVCEPRSPVSNGTPFVFQLDGSVASKKTAVFVQLPRRFVVCTVQQVSGRRVLFDRQVHVLCWRRGPGVGRVRRQEETVGGRVQNRHRVRMGRSGQRHVS